MAAAGVITNAQLAFMATRALKRIEASVAVAQFAKPPETEIIPEGAKSVTYNRTTALGPGGYITEGDSDTTITAVGSDLTLTPVTGTVVRRAGLVKMSDWSVRSNSVKVLDEAAGACGYGGALTVDSMLWTAMYGGTAIVGADVQYDGTDHWTNFLTGSFPFTTLMKDWLQGAASINNQTAISGTTAAHAGSVPVYVGSALAGLTSDAICLTSGKALVMNDLLDAVSILQDESAPYVDGMNYAFIGNGRQFGSLRKDTTFQAAVQQGAPEAMFNAEIASPVAGCRFVHSEAAPKLTAGSVFQADTTTPSTARLNVGLVIGQGALGCNKISKEGFELVYTPAGGSGDRLKELHTTAHKTAAAPAVLTPTWALILITNE